MQPVQDAPLTLHRQRLERDARVRHRAPRPPRGTHWSVQEDLTERRAADSSAVVQNYCLSEWSGDSSDKQGNFSRKNPT